MSKNERKQNDLYVVVVSSKEERNQLRTLCIKHSIPLIYPELFEEKKIHSLWGINKNGIGLVGTVIARYTQKDRVIHSLEALDNVLSNL